ncbi:MAG TPA: alkyl hydroperoxide reductase subunit F [Myxococcales bacterium]|jgi:alkyl hydroperoxide reductase subunit F
MLDPALVSQLKDLYGSLEGEYTLLLQPSTDTHQQELKEMLEGLASASPRIKVVEQGKPFDSIQFELLKNGAATGVRFRGVPGGHEFTSLVLAVLNADGKGKLPDEAVRRRVKALRGPIELRTYVSLSCTNCPDVVQALNQMALLHGDFRHEMVDGGLAEAEVSRLGIQAVPAVFAGDKLLHVGKSSFDELLDVLEGHFGHQQGEQPQGGAAPEPKDYDVVVVGGGPAGVSAAIYSARKGLKTALVAQKIGGQVRETVGIENLISVPYTEGLKLAADLDKHVRTYAVDVLEDRRVEEIRPGEKKEIVIKGGEVLRAPTLILATGARWRELGVPGEKEHIGRGVAFCPHCDGPFYKGKRVAVVGGGNSGVEAAIDLAGITSHVTLFEFLDVLKADEVLVRKLKSLPNVTIVTNARTTEVVGGASGVTAIRYMDRPTEKIHEVALDGVFVQIGLVPNSALVKGLVDTNRFGEIVIDERCRTSAPGIYAAGDVTTVPFKQIVIAMGEGAKAALTAFEDRIRGR